MSHVDTGAGPVDASVPRPTRVAFGIALHALLVSLFVIPPFQLIVPAIFVSAGLRYGRKAAWITIALAGSVILISALGAGTAEAAMPTVAAAGLLILQLGVPAVVLLQLTERGTSAGQALLTSLGIAMLGIVIVETFMQLVWGYSPYGGLATESRALFDQVIAMNSGLPADKLKMLRQISDTIIAGYLPAVVVGNTVLTFACSIVVLPRLRPAVPALQQYRLRNLVLPDWLLAVFIVAGLSPFAEGQLRTAGLNVLAIVTLIYWLQGLAVVRMVLTRSALRFFSTAFAFLLLLVLTFNWVGIVVLFLTGLFDSFFDFRNFKRKEDDSDESDLDG